MKNGKTLFEQAVLDELNRLFRKGKFRELERIIERYSRHERHLHIVFYAETIFRPAGHTRKGRQLPLATLGTIEGESAETTDQSSRKREAHSPDARKRPRARGTLRVGFGTF